MKTVNMTQGKPISLLLRFSLPLIVGNILQQLYSIVDTAIVGQGVGIHALAAVGAADWLNWFVLWILQGLTLGFSVLVSHKYGAGDRKGLKKTVAMSASLCVAIGILLTIAGEAAAMPALRMLNTPESIIDGALLYLRIIYGGILIIMAYNMSSCILRALGDSKTPMYAIAIATVVNITLDLLFVMVFHWGIAGAAIATVISQLFSFLYCLIKIGKLVVPKIDRSDCLIDGGLCSSLLKNGIPSGLSMAVIAVGGMVVQFVVNEQGTIFVAGFTATNKLYGLLEAVSYAYGAAMSTYMGQNIGARCIKRIRQGMRNMLPIAGCTAAVISVIMIVWGRYLLRLFISGDAAQALEAEIIAYQYLFVMSLFLWILYPVNIFRAALQGLGYSGIASVSGIVELALRAFVVLVLVPGMGISLLYFAESAAWIGSGIYLMVCFYWKVHRIEKKYGEVK